MKTHLYIIAVLTSALCLFSCKGNIDVSGNVHQKPSPEPDKEQAGEPWADTDGVDGAIYINNGKIQLGVDPSRGGTIFHFSEVGTKANLVNHYDEGREIQQSYYGWDGDGVWNGNPWPWNPVQGGSAGGVKGKITSKSITGTSIMIKSTPVLWASGTHATDCTMQEYITLEDNVAHVKFSFWYNGTQTGKARHQELPAFFVDWSLNNFVWYAGTTPWKGGELSSYVPDRLDLTNKNEYKDLSESWAAYVNDEGWGIGIYSPAAKQCTLYRYGSGPGGAKAPSCSYLAPIATIAVTANWAFSYDVYFTIGTKEQIRERFYAIHDKK